MADIKLYLDYIGITLSTNDSSSELLTKVVTAHLTKFPYDSTDLLLQGLVNASERKPTNIAIGSIFNQFIDNKRPGYCFQNNELLAWALEELGYQVDRCLAKPLIQMKDKIDDNYFEDLVFSHEALIVESSGVQWLLDTGFADYSLRKPLKLKPGKQELAGEHYNLIINEKKIRLETYTSQGWLCLMDVYRASKTASEIGIANTNFFITSQKFRIRDDYYKLAKVTPTKRKLLCIYKDSHEGFFKSYSGDGYKKEKEIKTDNELKVCAEKKFGIKVEDSISNALFQF
ncbi:MAG: arylamine N-acetyltransferase [Tatlockia sp.]|nr:arylamine N-acetyltransferase [Tatlockia sp.]